MIIQLRIDDRLLHGQVAMIWGKELRTKGIVIANDNAAKNEAASVALKMACPSDQKLLIKSVEDAKRVINDPRGSGMRILGIVSCARDALRLVDGCPGAIQEVNLANAGRFDGVPMDQKKKVTASVFLSEDEITAARELAGRNLPTFCQVAPNEAKADLSKLMAEL
jgi:fructoselysine and glucoselysine-specific PTS system IIB component